MTEGTTCRHNKTTMLSMWDFWSEMQFQLAKPDVWFKLVVSVVVAYAIYRFGRTLRRLLEPYISADLNTILRWTWLVVVVVGWLGLATFAAYLTQVPFFFDLGRVIYLALLDNSGKFIVIVAMALIAWSLIGTVSSRVLPADEFSRKSVRIQTLKGVVESTLKTFIVVISIIGGLQTLGVNAAGLLAGVSVLGVAVSFGAQNLVRDMLNGFFILLEDQYGVGDVITINTSALSGTVENLNLRVTTIRAMDGTVHIIPNGQINTVSVSSKEWSRVVATVGVSYDADIDKALGVLSSVSRELYEDPVWHSSFLDEPDIQGVTQLGDNAITLRALFKVQPKGQYAVGREFNRRIKIAMDEAGISIPYPQREVGFGGELKVRLVDGETVISKSHLEGQQRNLSPITPSKIDPEAGEPQRSS